MRQNRTRAISGCSPKAKGKKPKTYAEVVAKYLVEDASRGKSDLDWYAGHPDFDTLLEKAVLSRWWSACKSKELRHPHQRRIPGSVLRRAHRALSQCDLQSCKSFEELHDEIERVIKGKKISGIGPLAVFDFACRIGGWFEPKLEPLKVYLHSGTRMGASALKRGRGQKTIRVQDLPEEFHCLSGRQAEDCLCVYKDELKRIKPRIVP